jgi:hypothetical protein
MHVVLDADAAAIREVYERDGELPAAVELRRRFPGHPGQRQGAGAGEGYRVLNIATPTPSARPEKPEKQGAP